MKSLNKYEKQILLAYGKGELLSTAPTKEEKKLFVAAAKATSLPHRPVRQQATS
jgi:hypothetical protein